ncbi:DNA-processing protein DprA [Candidatus Woesebacteria bacterium]|nr:DNA-processing protein DprA [Candidatus Woesebacteria bacterium]
MSNDISYYLGFSQAPGIGPLFFDSLVSHFGSAEKAYQAREQEYIPLLGSTRTQKFISFRSQFDAERCLKLYRNNSITILHRTHPSFPQALLDLSDTPICLYIKGNLDAYDFNKDAFFAIVGTRKASNYGAQVARKFGSQLSSAHFVIVSGMALGVDASAHWGALNQGNRTIAVLGCGVNIVYPWANRKLYAEIIQHDGLVMSEFPPDMQTKKGMFVARNRLVSGLSKGVLVVEGTKDSGSLITARYAAEQGKDVFAVPAPITSELSQAPNLLIQQGAKLVTSVQDILDEYDMHVSAQKSAAMKKLSPSEDALVRLLSQEAFTPDELARTTQQPIHEILILLSNLELQGIITKNDDGTYVIDVESGQFS